MQLTRIIFLVFQERQYFRYVSVTTVCNLHWDPHCTKGSRLKCLSHSRSLAIQPDAISIYQVGPKSVRNGRSLLATYTVSSRDRRWPLGPKEPTDLPVEEELAGPICVVQAKQAVSLPGLTCPKFVQVLAMGWWRAGFHRGSPCHSMLRVEFFRDTSFSLETLSSLLGSGGLWQS